MENYCTVTGQTVKHNLDWNPSFTLPDATCLADKLTQMLQISICAIQQ